MTVFEQALSDHFLNVVIRFHKSASVTATLFTFIFLLCFSNLVFVMTTCDLNLLVALRQLKHGLDSGNPYFFSLALLFCSF